MPTVPAFPDALVAGLRGGPGYKTLIVTSDRGHEQRSVCWSRGLRRWSVTCQPTLIAQLSTLVDFFQARQGRYEPFVFTDPIEGGTAYARFDTDAMAYTAEGSGRGIWESIPIVEVRDPVGSYDFTEPAFTDLSGRPPMPPTPELSTSGPGIGTVPDGVYYVRCSFINTFTTPDQESPWSPVAGPITLTAPEDAIDVAIPAVLDASFGTPLLFCIYLSPNPNGPWIPSNQWSSFTADSAISQPALVYDPLDDPAPPLQGPEDEIRFPLALTRITGGPGYRTVIRAGGGGWEDRLARWQATRRRFELERSMMTPTQAQTLASFFRLHKGMAYPFLVTDPVSGEDVLARFDTDWLDLQLEQGMVWAGSVPVVEVLE